MGKVLGIAYGAIAACKGRQRHEDEDMTPEHHHRAMTWAQRLKRVFNIDVSTCPKRGGEARVIACIEDPVVIDKMPSLGPYTVHPCTTSLNHLPAKGRIAATNKTGAHYAGLAKYGMVCLAARFAQQPSK
jgi:hypothetical protein